MTYGSRYNEFKNGALKTSLRENVDLLVIANGVDSEYRKYLETLSTTINIQVVFLEKNEGSAGGFFELLTFCKKLNYEFYILLDDDNELVGNLAEVKFQHEASFFPRSGRTYVEKALKGINPTPYLAGENSFLGFDLKRIILKKINHIDSTKFDINSFNFPWAPYGGLILSKKVMQCGIMPEKRLFLYCDDTIYTNQISKKYGLYINSKLKIKDVDESWNVASKGHVITRIFSSTETWRTYYSVRNQVYFDSNRKNSNFYFSMNFLLFFITLFSFSIIYCIQDKKNISILKVFLVAVKDGLKGSLGNKGFDI